MKELRDFYIRSLSTMALIVALGVYAIPTHLNPFLTLKFGADHWSVLIANAFTSRIAIVIILALGELLIRKKLWRWFHPELDISGLWIGNNTYTAVHVGSAKVGADVQSGEHEVKIQQDCLSLQIAPSEGAQFGFWESKAIDLLSKDKLVYAYEVRYKPGTPERPPSALGYEAMTLVRENGENKAARMIGEFFHCASGQQPVLSGTVTFKRVKAPPSESRWRITLCKWLNCCPEHQQSVSQQTTRTEG